jgi:hypothetical protein
MKLIQGKSEHRVKKELVCDNMKGRRKLAKAVTHLTFVWEVPASADSGISVSSGNGQDGVPCRP